MEKGNRKYVCRWRIPGVIAPIIADTGPSAHIRNRGAEAPPFSDVVVCYTIGTVFGPGARRAIGEQAAVQCGAKEETL